MEFLFLKQSTLFETLFKNKMLGEFGHSLTTEVAQCAVLAFPLESLVGVGGPIFNNCTGF
jgi:hypothetical protein